MSLGNRAHFFHVLRQLTMVLGLLLTGCGGGTSGTGLPPEGRTTIISGLVISIDGQALSDVGVLDLVSGQATETNSFGRFLLEVEPNTDNVIELLLTSDGQSREVQLESAAAGAQDGAVQGTTITFPE